MKDFDCAYETRVRKSMLSGDCDGQIRSHVESCSICKEIVSVSMWMQSLAEEQVQQPDLPDSTCIWWNARLLQRQAAERKAARSVIITRILAYIAFTLGPGGWLLYRWQEVRAEIAHISRLETILPDYGFAPGLRPLIYLAVVLLGLNIALTLRTIRIEDGLKNRPRSGREP